MAEYVNYLKERAFNEPRLIAAADDVDEVVGESHARHNASVMPMDGVTFFNLDELDHDEIRIATMFVAPAKS
ncbi:uncharacterized protein AMSG_08983 [Thecamonas trahens ATCC 50062]|uniref:Uncharacterized protein n=1 Tax=Thecamonas trahens ATCC 50062 TaxID=461836 RepID=A0A0L0DKT0_THETB|nr:hypothetical protein AMSG_08983 [Thecamonas trahens ATCC 50062]KNC52840.1 hypothetical protein AMSG_08983 [Thecamonas trahens ATCC 50062]|eukprot:XP_013754945.1 hypothetical protein AMSG_08983 [Thecamonas trahens ATCC 50062]